MFSYRNKEISRWMINSIKYRTNGETYKNIAIIRLIVVINFLKAIFSPLLLFLLLV